MNPHTPGPGEREEEEFWFEGEGGAGPEPDEAPDYNFRDDARRTYMIVGSILAIFAFAGILWYLYYQKNLRDAENPPLITADRTPVKSRPDDPGGMEVPHQDKLIFDKVSGEETALEDSVKPGPEQPMDDLDDEPTIEDLIRETEPAPEPERTAETAAPPPAAPGAFLLQLGAFSQRANAEAAWIGMKQRHAAVLSGLTSEIDTITSGSGRTLYRLRAGAFATRAEAERACGRLKQAGQDCLAAGR